MGRAGGRLEQLERLEPLELPRTPHAYFRSARTAHLATADKSGQPHVIPICFVFDGKHFYSPIDEKPKRAASGQTQTAEEYPRESQRCPGRRPLSTKIGASSPTFWYSAKRGFYKAARNIDAPSNFLRTKVSSISCHGYR